MEDCAIIELFFARQERAITEASAKYGGYCHTVACNILGQPEDAEECVSDTWFRAWEAIPPRRPLQLRPFLARITRNLALNRWESRQAEKRGGGQLPLVLEELTECVGTGDPADDVLAKELEAHIRRFLASLPARERDLFLRRYFFTEPVKDIAARYGMSQNRVSAALSRTRKKLRTQLEQEGLL